MEFGLIFELSVPRPFTPGIERCVIENALEQIRLADELGLDVAWAVEHHFLEEYSHSSAPELFLTAAAQQTKRIRVGHGAAVCVPEINHPIRVAERAGVHRHRAHRRLIDPRPCALDLRLRPPSRRAHWRDDPECGQCPRATRRLGPPIRSRWARRPTDSPELRRRARRSSPR
jgi:hypothetical protein